MKILKICTKDNMHDCIPYSSVIRSNGTMKTIEQYSSENGVGVGQFGNYGEVVGIITGSGNTMLFSYKKDCKIIDPFSTDQDTTACISGWYDLNGNQPPNTWGKDIVGFHFVYGQAFAPTPTSQQECNNIKSKLGIKYCPIANDYWAGAVKTCNGIDNMMTKDDLLLVANLIFTKDENGNLAHAENARELRTNLFGTAEKVGIWAGQEETRATAPNAYKMFFSNIRENASYAYLNYDAIRNQSNVNRGRILGMCKNTD